MRLLGIMGEKACEDFIKSIAEVVKKTQSTAKPLEYLVETKHELFEGTALMLTIYEKSKRIELNTPYDSLPIYLRKLVNRGVKNAGYKTDKDIFCITDNS